ncbi:putative ATP-dependent helicase [Vairimorpha necatrix]|uniref:RNA helicase n=1 Tax=Vairimorpha necatrix TaxID=6039 RepID=A0AAX4JDV6_9MICR
MSKKKEKLLNKYLEKKRKQRKRDDILAQIAEIEEKRQKNIKNSMIVEESNKSEDNNKSEENNEEVTLEMVTQENTTEEIKDNHVIENNSILPIDIETDEEQDPELNIKKYQESISEEDEANIDDLDDFLGENQHWENVECLRRPKENEEFRKTLPIYYEKTEIISKIRNNTVISVKGETGSGKTTQIPQFLYEGGFKRYIGVTQPRRISTISICNRINEELGEKKCGYKIRYDSTVDENTKIKIMTDGILLKEIQGDFLLSKYSVIILDEIHERSANMDILISLLSRIVKIRKKRNDELKLVLMSATSMVSELNNFFDRIAVLEIPSNSHRVKIFYEEKDSSDTVQLAFNRISKILKSNKCQVGDSILCFLPDKKYIYSLLNKLTERFDDCVILPLHSSLSKYDQSLIYKNYNQHKIILSTNIAETSITIPDIYYVVDSGLVKRKIVGMMNTIEYSIEYISKSSALQRAGRAGRTKPGICYRLYSGPTYEKFEDLETPKILYESLDEIILDLVSLGIKDVYKFPYVNRPNETIIKKSVNELKRLGILNDELNLTKVGKYINKLPLPPRLAKMLCISNTSNIITELIDLSCIMSVNLEIDRIKETKSYYMSEKSDLIVILKIFRDFEKSKNKKDFCKNLNINFTTFSEVVKIQKFLYKKFGIENMKKNILTDDIKTEIRKVIYRVYFDRIAIPYEACYWHKKNPVYVSTSSIDLEGEYVIFDFLVKGSKKLYMKNITIIDKDWIS